MFLSLALDVSHSGTHCLSETVHPQIPILIGNGVYRSIRSESLVLLVTCQ